MQEEEIMAFDAQPAAPTPVVNEPETQFICADDYEGDLMVYDNTMANVIKPGGSLQKLSSSQLAAL